MKVVAALAQRVGDLVLHLSLGGLAGAHLALHLALVVWVVPSRVRGVKNDGEAHDLTKSLGWTRNARPQRALRGLRTRREMPAKRQSQKA
jgi:hypothetical protein